MSNRAHNALTTFSFFAICHRAPRPYVHRKLLSAKKCPIRVKKKENMCHWTPQGNARGIDKTKQGRRE